MDILSASFLHPWAALAGVGLGLLVMGFGLWAAVRPGLGVRVVGQRPGIQGIGAGLLLAGLGLGIAGPRWGLPEIPRLTVHVVLDASRSMRVQDCSGQSRWRAAERMLDKLWSRPVPGVRYSLDLLTGDTIPMQPPGEDLGLLRDALKAVQPGEIGSAGTSLGRGIPQIVATLERKEPAVILLVGDGEETWETPEDAQGRAVQFLNDAKLPLYAVALGGTMPQLVPPPAATPAHEGQAAQASESNPEPMPEPMLSAAKPELLRHIAEASGGKLLKPGDDLASLFQHLADGRAALPKSRSLQPAHPEWGAWLALAGLALWLFGAGKPLASWRPILGVLLFFGIPARAQSPLPLPQSVKAWIAQTALERGDLASAQHWRPEGRLPTHRLLAAQIDLKARDFQSALKTLTPLLGQGVPRPVPEWRAPALLLAARAQMALGQPDEAITLLERLLKEQPGQPDATHDLQSLLKDKQPPPPKPKTPPPPPPPPKPSQGARQDELEGMQQRMPHRPPPKGVKDL